MSRSRSRRGDPPAPAAGGPRPQPRAAGRPAPAIHPLGDAPATRHAVERLASEAFGPRAPGWLARKLTCEAVALERSLGLFDARGELLGYALIGWPRSIGGIARLATMAIAPRARGQGLGSALLTACVARARATGSPAVQASAEPAREGWFAARGFGVVARASTVALAAGSPRGVSTTPGPPTVEPAGPPSAATWIEAIAAAIGAAPSSDLADDLRAAWLVEAWHHAHRRRIARLGADRAIAWIGGLGPRGAGRFDLAFGIWADRSVSAPELEGWLATLAAATGGLWLYGWTGPVPAGAVARQDFAVVERRPHGP